MEGEWQKARGRKKNTITKESERKQWALESILTYHNSVNICGSFYALLNGYNLWKRKHVPVASAVKKDTVFFFFILFFFLSFRKRFQRPFQHGLSNVVKPHCDVHHILNF